MYFVISCLLSYVISSYFVHIVCWYWNLCSLHRAHTFCDFCPMHSPFLYFLFFIFLYLLFFETSSELYYSYLNIIRNVTDIADKAWSIFCYLTWWYNKRSLFDWFQLVYVFQLMFAVEKPFTRGEILYLFIPANVVDLCFLCVIKHLNL